MKLQHVAVAVGLLAVTTLSACQVSGLSFVADKRVEILEPAENATVSLPFTLRWRAEGYDGQFLVLFDRSPMRPGRSLRSLVPEDDACRTQPSCPDAKWLADRTIFVTDETSLVVERLPDRRQNARSADRHDVTIVLLDAEGRRIGESAFTREFIVEREGR